MRITIRTCTFHGLGRLLKKLENEQAYRKIMIEIRDGVRKPMWGSVGEPSMTRHWAEKGRHIQDVHEFCENQSGS